MKELIESRTTTNRSNMDKNQEQQGPPNPDEVMSNEYEMYTPRQILYSYFWCFWHICLRCIRRVRLTPHTENEFGFPPETISPGQLGGKICLIIECFTWLK